uniref:INO80 complex subunit E N-terminal domain-containing protein n=1 Tax=Varanus komodoensis TaxID=61221 RepID=A0A8D2LM33_VARKO
MNFQRAGLWGYKKHYGALKRRLKFLIYEQEFFQEELRKAPRKLLNVSCDKSFPFDHLLQDGNVDEETSHPEASASSDTSQGEMPEGTESQPLKRKHSPQLGHASPSSSGLSLQPTPGFGPPASGIQSPDTEILIREKFPRFSFPVPTIPSRSDL